jgi:hypothetical protein
MLNCIGHHNFKHEMDLHSMLKNTLQKKLENVYIKIQFNYEFKYNAQAIYNKHFFLYKQKVIS